MAVPALQAVRYLAKLSGWTYTNLELQNILYISHMLYLGQLQEPLVQELFRVGSCGPVMLQVSYHLQSYGAKPIPKDAFKDIAKLNKIAHKKEKQVLKGVARNFPHPSGPILIGIQLQQRISAWRKKYKSQGEGAVIFNGEIFEEYEIRYKKRHFLDQWAPHLKVRSSAE